VNSFRDCQSDQFGEEFVKAFGGIPKIGFLSVQLRAQASISLYIKKNIKKKILSEVAIFNMDVIKSYHVNYYQCQLSYQG